MFEMKRCSSPNPTLEILNFSSRLIPNGGGYQDKTTGDEVQRCGTVRKKQKLKSDLKEIADQRRKSLRELYDAIVSILGFQSTNSKNQRTRSNTFVFDQIHSLTKHCAEILRIPNADETTLA